MEPELSQSKKAVKLDSVFSGSDFLPSEDQQYVDIADYEKPKCDEHTGENVQMFCNKCDKMVCMKCVTGSHYGHKFSELDKAATKKKLIIKKHMINLQEKDCAELKEKLQKVREYKKEVKDRTISAKHCLHLKGMEFKEKVDAILQRMTKKLENQLTEDEEILAKVEKQLEEELSNKSSLVDKCQENFNSNRATDVIQNEKDLKGKLQRMQIKDVEISFPPVTVLDFVPGSISAEDNIVKQIGHLKEETINDIDFTFI